MFSEDFFLRHRHMPTDKICEKRIGIANPAKREERPGTYLAEVSLRRLGAKSSEPEQACLRVKYRELVGIGSLNRRALELSRNHKDIGSFAGGDRLAQQAGRQKPFLLKFARTIEHQDVQIPGKLSMLKTIIQNENVNLMFSFKSTPSNESIRTDAKYRPGAEAPLENLHFIAGPLGTLITATEDGDPLPLGQELLR